MSIDPSESRLDAIERDVARLEIRVDHLETWKAVAEARIAQIVFLILAIIIGAVLAATLGVGA